MFYVDEKKSHLKWLHKWKHVQSLTIKFMRWRMFFFIENTFWKSIFSSLFFDNNVLMKCIYTCPYLSKLRQWEFSYIKFYAIRPNINWDKSKVHGNDDDINNDIKVSINENAFFYALTIYFSCQHFVSVGWTVRYISGMASNMAHGSFSWALLMHNENGNWYRLFLSILYHTANSTVRILDIDRTRNAFGRRTNK